MKMHEKEAYFSFRKDINIVLFLLYKKLKLTVRIRLIYLINSFPPTQASYTQGIFSGLKDPVPIKE